jgi:hypothetical protein
MRVPVPFASLSGSDAFSCRGGEAAGAGFRRAFEKLPLRVRIVARKDPGGGRRRGSTERGAKGSRGAAGR